MCSWRLMEVVIEESYILNILFIYIYLLQFNYLLLKEFILKRIVLNYNLLLLFTNIK